MIPIPLRQNTAHQLTFAHGPVAGWIAAAVASSILGGLWYLAGGWRYLSTSSAGFFAIVACGSMIGVGIFAGLWRHRLTIYRRHRRWTRQRGLWPFVKATEGALGDAARVVLERKVLRNTDTGPGFSFPVTLEFGEDVTPVGLGKGTARVLGQRLMVEMASYLEVPAVDRSGPTTVTTPPQELEMPPDPHAG